MLSLRELRRAARIIRDRLEGAALRRTAEAGEHKLMLVFEQSKSRLPLLLSCSPEYARICAADPVPAVSSGTSSSFGEYARAHLPGMTLTAVQVLGEDRQLEFCLQKGLERFSLILSILGARSNLYLLDGEARIVHSMRPLEDTRRELKIGDAWANPASGAPKEGDDRWEDCPDEDYLDAIAKFYGLLERRAEAEQITRRIEQALKRERSFLDRKAINLQEDLGEARKAEMYRHRGELLKNVLHLIKPGDEFVAATDYETGETVRIPLDPKLSPTANLEACFDRYQKESRGVRMIEQQLQELEIVRADLESIALRLEEAARGENPNIEAIRMIASEPKVQRLVQRHAPKRKAPVAPVQAARKKEIPTRLLPKRYVTREGLEIWVGRSDEGNDYLTTRLARGNDLFFHLEGYPGSHVVLRTEGRPDPPQASLLDACELAVHFSKMKNAGSADVHMAHIKDVKKPKGAKPGLVYVRSGRTIHLRRDPKRLQNILASRLDQ